MLKKMFALLLVVLLGFTISCVNEDDDEIESPSTSKAYFGKWKNIASIGGSESDPINQYYTIDENGYTVEGIASSDGSLIDGNKGTYTVNENKITFTITQYYSEGYDGNPKGWNDTTSNDVSEYSYEVTGNQMVFTGVNDTSGTLEFEKVIE